MESALIISHAEKSTDYFREVLKTAQIPHIVSIHSCGEARRILLERDFDLIIVNAPLQDETGENLSRHVATKGFSQIILAVSAEHYDAVSSHCEQSGVITLSKPINKTILWSAIKLAKATQSKLLRMQNETNKLKQQIEDMRVVDRAKYILIATLNMSEQEAHSYIEKQAMDMRMSKRMIAERILRTYA